MSKSSTCDWSRRFYKSRPCCSITMPLFCFFSAFIKNGLWKFTFPFLQKKCYNNKEQLDVFTNGVYRKHLKETCKDKQDAVKSYLLYNNIGNIKNRGRYIKTILARLLTFETWELHLQIVTQKKFYLKAKRNPDYNKWIPATVFPLQKWAFLPLSLAGPANHMSRIYKIVKQNWRVGGWFKYKHACVSCI